MDFEGEGAWYRPSFAWARSLTCRAAPTKEARKLGELSLAESPFLFDKRRPCASATTIHTPSPTTGRHSKKQPLHYLHLAGASQRPYARCVGGIWMYARVTPARPPRRRPLTTSSHLPHPPTQTAVAGSLR